VGAMGQGMLQRSYLRIGTGSAPLSSARCVGLRLICVVGDCTSIARVFHPLHGPEFRALRPLLGNSPYVFTTEAGTPVTPSWFLRMVQRTGKAAKLPFPVHPHMLRHSTGYKLANDGHDTRSLAHYLGHRNLQSTARYTALAEGRFARFWQD